MIRSHAAWIANACRCRALANVTKLIVMVYVLALPAGNAAAQVAWTKTTVKIPTGTRGETTPLSIEAARLLVPENPAKPDGASVEIALLRMKTKGSASTSPIIFLHGGPGGAASLNILSAEFLSLFTALQEVGDVILFDQRGCGQSLPTLIPDKSVRMDAMVLASRESFLKFLTDSSAIVRSSLINAGHDPSMYTLAQSVADIERIRLALGAGRIRLVGHSYGTQLAQAYARSFPNAVEKMVLAGTRGMDTARKLPAEADAFLERVGELAKRDSELKMTDDLLTLFDRVIAKLDKQPLELDMSKVAGRPLKMKVGGYAIRFLVAKFYLNDPDAFRYLPKLLDDIDKGREPGSLIFNLRQLLSTAVSFTWFTTDAAAGASPARLAAIEKQIDKARLSDAMNFPFPAINSVWRIADAGDSARAPLETDIPTLFVVGTLDGITPVSQTQAVASQFRSSHTAIIENGGHVSSFRAPGLNNAIAEFLQKGTAPSQFAIPPVKFVSVAQN